MPSSLQILGSSCSSWFRNALRERREALWRSKLAGEEGDKREERFARNLQAFGGLEGAVAQ